MQSLIIRNFGPLRDINIELKPINLIFGKNGSGKSVLGKLIAIFKNNYNTKEIITKKLKDYNLLNYFEEKTNILFSCCDKKITYQLNKNEIKIFYNNREVDEVFYRKDLCEDLKSFPKYIPAERNIIFLFSSFLQTINISENKLPEYLSKFINQYKNARLDLKELNFLEYRYKFEDGIDKIFKNDNTEFTSLEKSSTGLKALLPLFLTIEYFNKNRTFDFIIEEPELNLFPCIQYEFVKFITSKINNGIIDFENCNAEMATIITHSPYIISSFNNLLFAYKVGKISTESRRLVNELIDERYWIDPDIFAASFLEDGEDRSIMSRGGLISESSILGINENISNKFDEILAHI